MDAALWWPQGEPSGFEALLGDIAGVEIMRMQGIGGLLRRRLIWQLGHNGFLLDTGDNRTGVAGSGNHALREVAPKCLFLCVIEREHCPAIRAVSQMFAQRLGLRRFVVEQTLLEGERQQRPEAFAVRSWPWRRHAHTAPLLRHERSSSCMRAYSLR